jgi:hypothetical protein
MFYPPGLPRVDERGNNDPAIGLPRYTVRLVLDDCPEIRDERSHPRARRLKR